MKVISWKTADFSELKKSAMSQNSHAKDIQILMPKLSELKEHKVAFDITVQVLRGEVEFRACGQSVVLGELDMVSLAANELHALRATKDSIVRLCLAIGDSEKMGFMP